MIIYLRDEQGIYSLAVEADPLGSMPRGFTAVPPPTLTGNQVARWNGATWDVLSVRPAEVLTSHLAVALNQTYEDVDSVYRAAIGLRATEYTEAEEQALAYVAAGYSGAVSPYISGHALNNPTGQVQTNAWAANEIIARANAFRNAQIALRSNRFASQAAMRAATTRIQLNAAIESWRGFVSAVFSQLGL